MHGFPEDLLIALREGGRVVALTGAGVSAESGVPTFRDAQTGLWSRFRPEQLATPEAFQRDPRLVWEWYAWRRELVRQALPNAGHIALAEIERRIPTFTLITQNVDGLHQRAGSRNIVELHGNLNRTRCSVEGSLVDRWEESGELPPRCLHCGGLLRPDVVWFGEALPARGIETAFAASRDAKLFFSIGTSALVTPAALLPKEALAAGAMVVEVNPADTPLTSEAHHVLRGPAAEVMPALVRGVWSSR